MGKQTPPKPRALMDMDGTGVLFNEGMTEKLRELMSPEEPERFEHSDEDKYPYIKARRSLIKNTPGFWLNLAPCPRGKRIYEMMLELGFRVTMLTRGPNASDNAWTEKFQACRKHFPKAKVTITNDEKGQVYGRVLVDDWEPYILPWLKWRPRGLVILPDQPWNRNFSHPRVVRFAENDEEIRKLLIAQRDRATLAPEPDESE